MRIQSKECVRLWQLSAVASDGVTCGARTSGTHGDGVIFVHGVGSTSASWNAQLSDLSDTFRCYAVDLRGNGATPEPPPESISREGFVRDVLAVADAAGLQTFHYIGCSLGGVVGFELSQTAPARVRSYTIVGSFAKYPDGQTNADGIIAALNEVGDMREFTKIRAARLGVTEGPLLDNFLREMGCKSIASYTASTQATWTGDYREILSTIAAPTLVVVGESDTVAPPVLSQEIAQSIPGARYVIIPEAGHVCNADNPKAFNRVLRDFLTHLEKA